MLRASEGLPREHLPTLLRKGRQAPWAKLAGFRSQTATLSQHCVPGLDSTLHGAHYLQRQHSTQAPTQNSFPESQGRAGTELGHPHVSADLTHLCFTFRLLKIR